ncbi:Phage protein [Bacillus pseudomycoides]|nr:Protein of unknown function [Bacillus mycoides]
METTIGALIFSVVIYLVIHPVLTPLNIIVEIVSRLFWSLDKVIS